MTQPIISEEVSSITAPEPIVTTEMQILSSETTTEAILQVKSSQTQEQTTDLKTTLTPTPTTITSTTTATSTSTTTTTTTTTTVETLKLV
jgi:hypothetical protein